MDIDQKSLAQGTCNIGSGLIQGIPVSTSLSPSSLNDTSGAETQVTSLTTGAVIVLTMPLLAQLFCDLRKACLPPSPSKPRWFHSHGWLRRWPAPAASRPIVTTHMCHHAQAQKPN